MYFIIASLVIGLSCSLITIKILTGYNKMPTSVKLLISAFIVIGWFAPVIIGYIRRHILTDGFIFNCLSNFLYYLFGLVFILFTLLMLRDLVWFAISGISRIFHFHSAELNPKNPMVLGWANLSVVAVSLLLSFYAVYEAVKFPTLKEITYYSTKVKKPTKIVLLNDTHITRSVSANRIEKIVNYINSLKPDVVVMAGDIVDDQIPAIADKLEPLKNLKAPLGVFASTGNHELYAGIPAWYYKFKNLGIKILSNEGVSLGSRNIFIAGLPDMTTSASSRFFAINPKTALQNSRKSEYKIVLSHNPDINLEGEKVDLQLSGHTHGGQIFPFHYAVENVNKYLAGSYKVGDMDLYVSRGAGYWGPPMRLFAPSEITLINIVPQTSEK